MSMLAILVPVTSMLAPSLLPISVMKDNCLVIRCLQFRPNSNSTSTPALRPDLGEGRGGSRGISGAGGSKQAGKRAQEEKERGGGG